MTTTHPLPDLAATIADLGPAGLQDRREAVRRLVADDGITWGGARPDAGPRPWEVDPLPLVLPAAEWAAVETALAQRARLLDALLADLYGPRRVLHDRLVPAEVVLGHSGFLAPADRIRPPAGRQLVLTATDLGRGPDGTWTVLADRPEAPAGAGYAMANRRIIARAMEGLHRETRLRHLRGFFDVLQLALLEAAPPVDDPPRVVMLSPGADSETAYDQALLSTLLGFPLAESDDLLVRGGRVWLRTTGRLQAVDVLLRRVDAAWSDSLDLRPDSRLGVPGLTAAARSGAVSVVNPLGAGVLENPGLLPYLDAVARALLGETPLLPSPPTWWCGDDASRSHVLAHLSTLVVKPLSRDSRPPTIPGWELDANARDDLRRRIEAAPWAWTAQEPVPLGTAPVVTSSGLVERPLVLRTFGATLGRDHHLLPGGLARVASGSRDALVTTRTGAVSKDVWVLEEAGTPRARLDVAALARTRHAVADAPLPGLTPRAAASLFRLGRHVERAEGTARLLLMADNLVEDHLQRPGSPGHQATLAVLDAVAAVTGTPNAADAGAGAGPDRVLASLRALLVDPGRPGSVAYSARQAEAAAAEVREQLSQDTPAVLSRLDRTLRQARSAGDAVVVQAVAATALESCLALAGLTAESLVRDPTWAFLDAGRRLQRARTTLRLLRATLASVRPAVVEGLLVDAVLRVGDSLITYRRRVVAGVGSGAPVVAATHLLLADAGNPRSVLYQAERLEEALAHAPDASLTAAVRALLTALRTLDLHQACAEPRSGLAAVLDDLDRRVDAVTATIRRVHFRPQQPHVSFAVEVARSAGGPR